MATEVGSDSSIAPAPSSCGELVRAVLDYCQAMDTPERRAVAQRELNFATDEINSRTWKKLVGVQTITLVADDLDYSLASDFKDPFSCTLLNSSSERVEVLGFEEWQTFQRLVRDMTLTGDPSIYTIDYANRLIVLDSKPTTSFLSHYPSAELRYYRRLARCSQPSDLHGGPPEFGVYLLWQARAGYAAISGEDRLARYAEAKARDVMQLLRRDDGNTQTDWAGPYYSR